MKQAKSHVAGDSDAEAEDDDAGMDQPTASHVAGDSTTGNPMAHRTHSGIMGKNESDDDQHAAASTAVKVFALPENPGLFARAIADYFADLTDVDTTVVNSLTANFIPVVLGLYDATGSDSPVCRAGITANVQDLYQRLSTERDTAAALNHIDALTTQHQAMLDALKAKGATHSPTTQQPGAQAAFPGAKTDGDDEADLGAGI